MREPTRIRLNRRHWPAAGWFLCGFMAVVATAKPSVALPATARAAPFQTQSEAASTVSFGDWLGALTAILDTTPAPAISEEYSTFVTARAFSTDNPKLKQDYRRLRLLFEALRDGGFWHLRWAITDKEPSSQFIWKYWLRDEVRPGFAEPSATAECDESSALFGMLARHLHVYNVGLFYPTWNHTIAVWAPLEGKAKKPLVQLPTTQIFLDCEAGFDQTTFRTGLKNIERYPNWDVRANTHVPAARAEWLLHQVRVYSMASPALWSLMRAKRAFAMRSSMGACTKARAAWYAQLNASLTDGDRSALKVLATEELGLSEASPLQVLAWLRA